MRKPRKTSLTWALDLFATGKTRAEMDQAIEAAGGLKDPHAHAVRYCWHTGREWVNARLADGKDYESIAVLADKVEGEDPISPAVRKAALEEIKRENHRIPQPSGSRSTRPKRLTTGKARSLSEGGVF